NPFHPCSPLAQTLYDKGRAEQHALPSSLTLQLFLEVEADYELDQTATRIVGGGEVLISGRVAAEGCRIQASESVYVVCGSADEEVDVVEGIEKLASQLQVGAFRKLESLHYACVCTEERWSVQYEISETTVALDCLSAVTETCRSDEASGRCALCEHWTDVGAGSIETDAVRLPRVGADVLREDVNVATIDPVCISFATDADRVLQLFQGHADELDVSKRERRAAL